VNQWNMAQRREKEEIAGEYGGKNVFEKERK
jgi:hypothetical protein